MNKPSRREIEQLVKSRPKIHSARSKLPIRDDHRSRRQSRVLGGNLTGIKKKKQSKNIISWLLVAGLVLLSGLVFIIPAFNQNSPKISKNKTKEPIAAIYQDSLISEQTENDTIKTSDSITIPKDRERVKEYRQKDAQEQALKTLKEQAQTAISAGNYTKPKENSAYHYFKQILAINANDSFAKKGVDYLVNRLHILGMNEIEKNNIKAARRHLASLFSIDTDSEKYIQLSEAISNLEIKLNNKKQQKEIEKILAKAEKAIARKRYMTPKNDNALNYYQQILEKDENNSQAQQGITTVANFYSNRATQFINNSEWERASLAIENLKKIPSQQNKSIELERNLALAKETVTLTIGQTTAQTAQKQTAQKQTTQKQTTSNSAQELTANTEISTATKLAPTQDRSVSTRTAPRKETLSTAAPVTDSLQTNARQTSVNNAPKPIQSEQSQLNAGLQAYYNSEYVTAFSYLAPLAEKNNTRAQIRVGYMYQFGRGVEQNKEVGNNYLRNALPSLKRFANQNQAWAQSDLGSLYEDGIVVTKSFTEALTWYRRAAAQNYTGAQTNLGNMYFFGNGVEKNEQEAIRWYRLAAAGGDAIAKQNLIQLGAFNF